MTDAERPAEAPPRRSAPPEAAGSERTPGRDVLDVEVGFADCGGQGTARLDRVHAWVALGRDRVLAGLGLPMPSAAVALAGVELQIRRPPVLGERVRVHTEVERITGTRCTLTHRLLEPSSGAEVGSGRTEVRGPVRGGRHGRLPDELLEAARQIGCPLRQRPADEPR